MRNKHSESRRRTISGRTVVITGAVSGMGRALAQRLSAHGCAVIADIDGGTEGESALNGPTLTNCSMCVMPSTARLAGEIRVGRPNRSERCSTTRRRVASRMPSRSGGRRLPWDINFHGVVNGPGFLPILVEQDEVHRQHVAVGSWNRCLLHSRSVLPLPASCGTGVTASMCIRAVTPTSSQRRFRMDPEAAAERWLRRSRRHHDGADSRRDHPRRGAGQRTSGGPDAYLFDALVRSHYYAYGCASHEV